MANGIASLRGYQQGGPPDPQERPDSFLDRLKKLLAKLSVGIKKYQMFTPIYLRR